MSWPRAAVLIAACTVLVALLAGCASAPPEADWRGKKIDEAIAQYGPPTAVSPSDTGALYLWRSRREMHGMGGLPGTTREFHVTTRMMTVDANGIITSYTREDQ